jgi:PAS domain S-box-containing protein
MNLPKSSTIPQDIVKEITSSDHFIESLVNLSPDILYIYDIVSRQNIYTNNGVEKVLGYTVDEIRLMGTNVISFLMHPDDLNFYLSSIIKKYNEAKDKEQIIHHYRMKHKCGDWRWLESTELIYKRLPDGSPCQIFGVVHDITCTKQFEDKICMSEQLLKQSQRIARLGHYVYDIANNSWTCSEMLHEIFGIDESITKDYELWAKLVYKDDQEEMTNYFLNHVLKEKHHFDKEYRLCQYSTGTVLWVHGLGKLEFDKNGVPIKMFGTIQDISSKKKDETELRESEDRFRKLFDGATDGIVVTDIETKKFIIGNNSFAKMLGYETDDIPNLGISDIHPKASMPLIYTSFELHLEYKDRISEDIPVIRKNGELIYCDIGANQMVLQGRRCLMGSFRDITRRKKAEQELKASEEKFRNLVNNINTGIFISTMDGTFIFANNKVASLAGYNSPEEFIKIPSKSLYVNIEDRNRLIELLKSQGFVQNMELQSVRQNGSEYTVSLNAVVQNNEDGNPEFILGSIDDITGIKQANEKVASSKKNLQLIFDNTGTANSIFDTNYRLILQNSMSEKRLGRKGEDAIGKSVIEFFGENTGKIIEKRMEDVFSTGIPQSYETEFNLPDGKYWFRTIYQPIFDTDHKITQLHLISQDITETKKSELLLEEEKERLSVTLRSIGDGVIATDTQGCVLIMNKVAEELTGWTQQDAVGKPLSQIFIIVNEITREPSENPVDKVLSSGMVIELANHTLLISKDSTERVITDSGAPIRDKNGAIIGVVLVFRDTTEKVKLMENAHKTQRLESLGILAGGIAHDFNNLLGGIFGYLDLARALTKERTTHDYLENAMKTMNRAKALTQQLLTFAKGGTPIRKVESLTPFIQESVTFALSGSKLLSIFQINPDLWNCSFDRNQIAQVLDNIIINAQQAMPVGGTITIKACNETITNSVHPSLQPGKYVRISIKDEGIGIPKEIISRIFDPFFTTKQKGSGLGLATCYSIISQHNGTIDVESDPGKGSTFHIFLPASNEPTLKSPITHIKKYSGTGRILLMDDELIIRDTTSAILKLFGYSCHSVTNGAEAILEFTNGLKNNDAYKAVILDLTVPGGMGGLEAGMEIRKIDSQIPIFVASGYADDAVIAEPEKFGFTGSISKPFKVTDLGDLLEKFLSVKN